ncbi:hypothetical protein [Legionella sainthelensi]|uniref:hypothetical protein n=1 Tax=Legionella sainthelensi TaxID=28087 RepID=UPI000E208376|nr:hypothetical protein [Legionella sainthelensi]
MNSKVDSLALALKQSFLGIYPRRTLIDDYKILKARIKKELKIALTVKEIDQISFFVVKSIWNVQTQDSSPQCINSAQAIAIASSNTVLLEEDEISQKIDKNKVNQVITIVVEEMIQFKNPAAFIKNTISLRSKMVWDAKTYESKKLQLESLLKRELLKEEVYLIAETWFHYMVFAEDLRSPDNYTKEKIKELKAALLARIDHFKGVVKSSKEIIEQVRDIDRFPWINIEVEEKILLDAQNKLEESEALAARLRQENGYPLSINHIQEQAYFSAFFLGELLGLSEPKYNKDGNPLLTFLDILIGWTDSKMDKDITRKRISSNYSTYKQFKLNQHAKPFMDNLFRCHQEKKRNLRSILKDFQTYLLQLSIKPSPLSIAHDA